MIIKPKVEIKDIKIVIKTGNFNLESSINDLPTDILEKIAVETNYLLLDRDEDWNTFLEEGDKL